MIDDMHTMNWNDWWYAHYELKKPMVCTLWIEIIEYIHSMNWIEMIDDMHTIHWNDWYYAHYKLNWFELIDDKPTINWNPPPKLSCLPTTTCTLADSSPPTGLTQTWHLTRSQPALSFLSTGTSTLSMFLWAGSPISTCSYTAYTKSVDRTCILWKSLQWWESRRCLPWWSKVFSLRCHLPLWLPLLIFKIWRWLVRFFTLNILS